MRNLIALAAGLLFGIGLAMSGMTDTGKVLGFLDLFGAWVPDLAFVMGGAVLVTLIGFRLVLRRPAPFADKSFSLPGAREIDIRLVAGAAIFGLGWGLYGYCPGPALASLVYADTSSAVFVVMMLTGMWLANRAAA